MPAWGAPRSSDAVRVLYDGDKVMHSSKSLAAIVTLAISAGLAGMACMAQPSVETIPGDDEAQAAPADQAAEVGHENTGEATEKCGFGGGFGWSGLGCGGFGWSGFGWSGIGCGGFFPGFWGGVGIPFNGVGCILPFNGLGVGGVGVGIGGGCW